MIRIPFNRRVILTTLNFLQIADRLESAIYVGAATPLSNSSFPSSPTTNSTPKHQHYSGQIRSFKFVAHRIIGHKYLRVPVCLLPTIEGKINGLHHGYQISLAIGLHNATFALLLTWLGGLLILMPSVVDNILADSKNYQYLTTVAIAALLFTVIFAYLYFDAWRAAKFFETLFAQGFTATSHQQVGSQPTERSEDFLQELVSQRSQKIDESPTSTDWLRKNLPSFPSPSSKV